MAIDTSNRLPVLAEKINAEHSAAHGHARQALEQAAECGRHLIEAKQLAPHGQWLSWLEGNTSVGARQSQKYMRLAEGWAAIEANATPSSHLTINQALELIAEPKPEAKPDPDAVAIASLYRKSLAGVGTFASTAREMRAYFKGDDQRLKAALMTSAEIGRGFADKVPALIDNNADAEQWLLATLDNFESLIDSYQPPKGKRMIHGCHSHLEALRAERIALRDEVETASASRLKIIINRCHQIEIRSYAIKRSASEMAATLNHLATYEAQA